MKGKTGVRAQHDLGTNGGSAMREVAEGVIHLEGFPRNAINVYSAAYLGDAP